MQEFYISKYSCKYIANKLSKRGGEGIDRLSQSLFNSNVDLNPHQVEAALFAIHSPFTQGVLLADEVGLGKTIEAGLVIAQYWAEYKRKILVISPASLRKQWQMELEEKFAIPCVVIDRKRYNEIEKKGYLNPFDNNKVIISSYHFVARNAENIKAINWDLIVIDEAHKLRNSYRPSNKIGQRIRWATQDRRKILITATPLQNSLSELYGIISIIDEKIFGSISTFRTLYSNADADLNDLKLRIKNLCKRTLRKDVLEFIKYTQRRLITVDFIASDEEYKLYQEVSKFLQRDDTYSFPKKQRHLIIMIVRKVMASSTYALSKTLETVKKRLLEMRKNVPVEDDFLATLIKTNDIYDELWEDEILEENAVDENNDNDDNKIDLEKIDEEIKEIDKLIHWAKNIGIDTKTKKLLTALKIGYQEMEKLGANKKAVIFTESRRTMEFLRNFLEQNGYRNKVLTYSGKNNDPKIKEIYRDWLSKNNKKTSSSKAVNIRHAIIDNFKNNAEILIATEAGAEGINLQFCSLLINFDLPWNPQRIEQRIGRIHRYGQKFDVVVINFLNKRNAADMRVYDLLRHKFNLFEGIFGSSDEVLGQIESSVGLEKRIAEIYQNCRTEKEIEEHFNILQKELEEQIQDKLAKTREQIFTYFDEDVRKKLKIDYKEAILTLDNIGKDFWRLSKSILKQYAVFDDKNLSFELITKPIKSAVLGRYVLPRKANPEKSIGFRYTMNHPLGEYCINTAKSFKLNPAFVEFSISDYKGKISVLENLKNTSGWLILDKLSIKSIESEEYLLFTGFDEDGNFIKHEIFEKMFRLDSKTIEFIDLPNDIKEKLSLNSKVFAKATTKKALEKNNALFLERREQLYRWAEDVVLEAEKKLSQIKAELRAAERAAAQATNLVEQKEAQKKIAELEKKKRAARRKIWEVEDNIAEKRNKLIKELEEKMIQKISIETLFIIKWKIV